MISKETISLEGEDYHFGPFDLVRVNGCYGHNCVLGSSHIQYYLSLGVLIGLIVS